jgi:hypothetical protein
MAQAFVVKRADDLLDAEFTARWRDRQALDPLACTALGTILDRFLATGGPVKVDDAVQLLPQHTHAEVTQAIRRLDEKDLVLLDGHQVTLAYPFASSPTAFRVLLPGRRERYAVCAIDALGVPAMLGQPVTIRSQCHHCQEPFEIEVRPTGPIGHPDIMVWVGERGDPRQKACASVCTTINFFRSEEHLAEWCADHPDVRGAAAVLDEAFLLGAKVFGDLLRSLLPGTMTSNTFPAGAA